MMRRVYIPYWDWECHKNGMWRRENNEHLLAAAVSFTGNTSKYGSAMFEVIKAWPLTMLHNLTNPSVNKLAFIGHCAACYKEGLPEAVVRQAWKLITEKQRNDADEVAMKAFLTWKSECYGKAYSKIRKNVGEQMLLRWHT